MGLLPLDLLKKELKENQRALNKSISLYQNNQIDAETHTRHRENLSKLIGAYSQAITLLEFNNKWNELTQKDRELLF